MYTNFKTSRQSYICIYLCVCVSSCIVTFYFRHTATLFTSSVTPRYVTLPSSPQILHDALMSSSLKTSVSHDTLNIIHSYNHIWHLTNRVALLRSPLSRVIDENQAWQTKSKINASPEKDRRHSGVWTCSRFWHLNARGKKKTCVSERVSENGMLMRGGWQALCLHLSPPLLPESSYCLRRTVWVAMATVAEWDMAKYGLKWTLELCCILITRLSLKLPCTLQLHWLDNWHSPACCAFCVHV